MVISHNLGEMGRCLAIVTWLELLPHQSNEEMYTCQQHEVKSGEDIIFAYCIGSVLIIPAWHKLVHSHSNSKAVREATLKEPHYVIQSLQEWPPRMLSSLYMHATPHTKRLSLLLLPLEPGLAL